MADERQTAEDRLMEVAHQYVWDEWDEKAVRQAALAWVVAEIEWMDCPYDIDVASGGCDGEGCKSRRCKRIAKLRERMS